MSDPPASQGKPSRPGRGRGKSRGRGRDGRGRGRGRGDNHQHGYGVESNLSDEDVMIAFMKHLRVEQDPQAKEIFTKYGSDMNASNTFIEQIRQFLSSKKEGGAETGGLNGGRDQVQFRPSPTASSSNGIKSPFPAQDHNRSEKRIPKSFERPKTDIANNLSPKRVGTIEIDQNQRELEEMVSNLTVHNAEDNISRKPAQSALQPPPGMPSGYTNMKNIIPQTPPSTPIYQSRMATNPPPGLLPSVPSATSTHSAPEMAASDSSAPSPLTVEESLQTAAQINIPPAPPKWQPRRLNTRQSDQPGRILANNIPATVDGKPCLTLRPRQELTATWSLPLAYLRERTLRKIKEAKEKAEMDTENPNPPAPPANLTIRDALRTLTVGLFRRGCPENGSNCAIIAKEVVPAADRPNQEEYHFEINQQNGTIWGTVPFFTPRTPGNVVLRLYFEDDTIMTLAVGQCISVIVTANDMEQTLRFILSNFKSKRGATNFSSIHSLAAVLEQYAPAPAANTGRHQNHHHQSQNMDGAGRAAWGGICESKKVVDACKQDYLKKKAKLEKEINEHEALKEEIDLKVAEEGTAEAKHEDDTDEVSGEVKEWREKMNAVMGERASNERKWREIQSAFASVLQNAIRNPASPRLLKPDIIKKLELEYNLWCPLCENFAPNPYEEERGDGSTSINYPYPIHHRHIRACMESRSNMQQETLGFQVKTALLTPSSYQNESGVCVRLTRSMEKLYDAEYGASSALILRKKALVRELAESAVTKCDALPIGTKVVVFGSSANGFGSPNSDLDMCLQVPQGAVLSGEEGIAAMGKLAEKLVEAGMIGVDTARLTARIPVIKFDCRVEVDGYESIIECDISMQNPLACINTGLLHSYSTITPEVRIIAAIVKRWAKRRNINDPSHHTLSSYGYIIMLLHFMTTHKAADNGGVESIFYKKDQGCPLLPNLQWMDQRWLQSAPGTKYSEWQQKPSNQYTTMKHPTEEKYVVNTYYLRINEQPVHSALTKKIESNTAKSPPVGYLLSAFFKYYAFHFDYKKHIVSLNARTQSGPIEREAKAESDGWKLFGQSLSIEDPFEEFYDVAHVLKPLNFQRTKKEFALAYSKIVTCMSTDNGSLDADDLLDAICEEHVEDK